MAHRNLGGSMVYHGAMIRAKVCQLRTGDWVKESRVHIPHGHGWTEYQVFGETTAQSEEVATQESIELAKAWIDSTFFTRRPVR